MGRLLASSTGLSARRGVHVVKFNRIRLRPGAGNALPMISSSRRDDRVSPPRTNRPGRMLGLLACAALLAGLAAEGRRWLTPEPVAAAVGQADWPTPNEIRLVPLSTSALQMPAGAPAAHASALTVLPGDEMRAFWWAGSRESGPDVQVFSARWSKGGWSEPRAIVSRDSLGAALGFGVRRVGNPAAWYADDGQVHLYVVATGLGGWAASRVVHLVSPDEGETFAVRRVLPLAPFFNTSALVRTNPVGMADGGWWLPLYFELGNKYPMLMSFDRRGEPRWVSRIGSSTTALQPAIAPVSGLEVRAWMRDIGEERRVQQAISRDGGVSWEDLPSMAIPNDDNSVAVLRLSGGGYVMLHNDRTVAGGSARSVLRLSHSVDAKRWVHDHDVVSGDRTAEFSYPSVQQVGNELHVTYTAQREGIAHHVYQISYGRTTS